MRQRHSQFRTGKPIARATAIALFCLAGTDACLAQFSTPKNAVGNTKQPAGGAGGQSIPDLEGKVKVDREGVVDLHVNDEDLANVLQMLSIQSQKNIISSKNVSATVTANLYGVTFYEAMDAILHVNGFGYVERGNFIYVYTLEELKAIEEASRQKVSRVFKLSYLNSTDAAEFVKGLLSDQGQIKTNGKTGNFPGLGDVPVGGEDFAHDSTMVVTDFEENVTEIETMIKQLDTKPVQVLVEATILQTSLNEANAFGVDFSFLADMSFGEFLDLGGPLSTVDGLIGGSGKPGGGAPALPGDDRGGGIVTTPGNTSGPATFKFGIVWNDVAAFVRLLDEVSDTEIISRPNILTLNRQPARVLVGRKVGYLNTTSTDTATTQTVEFLDTGTQLYLRPFVSTDGSIRMELKPQVSEAVIREVTDAGGAAVTIPDEITNELTTNVMVKDGQTIVLGGLFRESTTTARRQVPWVGDIPLIGAAFRGHDDETERSEIMFMVTPTVVNDPLIDESAARGMTLIDRARTGAREGLLPWSREKHTGKLLMEAERLAREGRTSAALSKVNRALRLSHMQPDAIALRERLMNKRDVWPSRNLLDEVIHGEMQKRIEGYQPRARRRSTPTDDRAFIGYVEPAKAATTTPEAKAPKSKPLSSFPPEAFESSPTWEQIEAQERAWREATVPENFGGQDEGAGMPGNSPADDPANQGNEPTSSEPPLSMIQRVWNAMLAAASRRPAATTAMLDD